MKAGAFVIIYLVFLTAVHAQIGEKIKIEGGNFIPFYGLEKDQKNISVASFFIDKYPVTHKEFFNFTESHPKWRFGRVSSLLADKDYLKYWKDGKPSRKLWDIPVTYVSWFSAQAYCAAQGGKLPTVFEWEYVGQASQTQKDASYDKEFIDQLLQWYSKPVEEGKIQKIGQQKPNVWGVYDMHGVIWEWVYDFNSVFVTGDNRQDKDKLQNLFCGFGGEGAQNRANYAAFMRYALRNSLKGHYTMMNLGFRCAYPIKHLKHLSSDSNKP